MTGPEHYQAAERLLSDASFTTSTGTPVTREGRRMEPGAHASLVDRAQVHATLALAAASIHHLIPATDADREGWSEAVSTPDPDIDPLDNIA